MDEQVFESMQAQMTAAVSHATSLTEELGKSRQTIGDFKRQAAAHQEEITRLSEALTAAQERFNTALAKVTAFRDHLKNAVDSLK